MKRLLIAATAFGALACAAPSVMHAQDAPASIKVTTKINADGSRTDTQKNLDARTSESTTYDRNHKVVNRVVFTLDDQGRETEGVAYNAKNQVTSRATLNYDAQGRISEQMEKSPTGQIKRRIVFKRDAEGRVTAIEAYDGQGKRIQADTDAAAKPVRVRPKK